MTPTYCEYLGSLRNYSPSPINCKQAGAIDHCLYFYIDEELNGPYTCEFQVSVGARCANQIKEGTRILAKPNDDTDYEVFEVTSKRVDVNTVTFYGEHISAVLRKRYIAGYNFELSAGLLPESRIQDYVNAQAGHWADEDTTPNRVYFEFRTDVQNDQIGLVLVSHEPLTPWDFIEMLRSTFGGDWKWSKNIISLLQHRGSTDKHVIRTGKNLLRMTKQSDSQAYINCITPYWFISPESYPPDGYYTWYRTVFADDYDPDVGPQYGALMRLNDEFDEDPGAAMAASYAAETLRETIKAALEASTTVEITAQTNAEGVIFKNFQLGDEVDVWFERADLRLTDARIVKMRYDPINERTISVTVGKLEETYGDVLRSSMGSSGGSSSVTPSGGGGIIYSTAEVATGGKWIDGKPVYRKVITGSVGTTEITLATISDIDVVVSINGTFNRNSDDMWQITNYFYSTAAQNYVYINSGGAVKARAGAAGTVYVTIEYTKTTD